MKFKTLLIFLWFTFLFQGENLSEWANLDDHTWMIWGNISWTDLDNIKWNGKDL